MNKVAIPIAIVGVGKIARDQHLPTIVTSPDFRLVGAVSRHALDLQVPVCSSLTELKAAVPELAAVAVCTPPVDRLALLTEAFALGLNVLMEKPPARTISEAERFASTPREAGRVLFQSWHSRSAAGVQPMKEWLAKRIIRHVEVEWLEDVRVWHPGQDWIWSPGIGVFDPGINALSILTEIFPSELTVRDCRLAFPANRSAPIAAELTIDAAAGYTVDAEFSFDQRGPQSWTISIETDEGTGTLADGGGIWMIDNVQQPVPDERAEYHRLYERFAHLIERGESDIDMRPFRLVTDAFLVAERHQVAVFEW